MRKKLFKNVLYMFAVLIAVLAFGYVVLLNDGFHECSSCGGHHHGEHNH